MLILPPSPHARLRLAVALLAALALLSAVGLTVLPRPAASASLGSLGSLGSRLGAEQARQGALGSTIAGLSRSIAVLRGQIAFIEGREAAVRGELARDRAELIRLRADRRAAIGRLARLRAEIAWARTLLARQLVSRYERGAPDLVEVVVDAAGFTDLLERMTFLRAAEGLQQRTIDVVTTAKRQTARTAARLAILVRRERTVAGAAATRVQALAGMDVLLGQRTAALASALSGAQAQLTRSRAVSASLRTEIAQVRAAQAAAAAAAAARARDAAARAAAVRAAADAPAAADTPAAGRWPAAPSPSSGAGPSTGGAYAIPSSVVLCESGGQNLTPNSAGASGYYQIVPGTWKLYGGSGPAAYLAPKSEQDAVAQRIWGGGSGASNWVCANALGIG